jgi:hypothetical protein
MATFTSSGSPTSQARSAPGFADPAANRRSGAELNHPDAARASAEFTTSPRELRAPARAGGAKATIASPATELPCSRTGNRGLIGEWLRGMILPPIGGGMESQLRHYRARLRHSRRLPYRVARQLAAWLPLVLVLYALMFLVSARIR